MKTDLRLYEFPEAIDRILEDLQDGEMKPDQEAELDRLLGALDLKVRSVLGMIRHLDSMEERTKIEKERLARIQKTFARRAESLRTYLARCMAHADIARMVTDIGTVTRATNSRPTIRWAWVNEPIPEEFRRTKIVQELDADKALAAWKAGTLPPGFDVELGESLRIR
jgi:hypothetical protein